MFQDLAKDTGKGNGTVVYSLGFVTFFEHWGDKSTTPVCGETGKHFYLPNSTEKTHARSGLYALWITILCVLDNKDVNMWQEKVYNPKT